MGVVAVTAAVWGAAQSHDRGQGGSNAAGDTVQQGGGWDLDPPR